MSIAEQVFDAVKALPEQQAAEVLNFVEFLKTKSKRQHSDKRENAFATLDKYAGLYDGSRFSREELHERP